MPIPTMTCWERCWAAWQPDDTGRPVAGARVAASPFRRNLDTIFTTSNSAGEYFLDLPDGDYVVYVDAAGYETGIEAASPRPWPP
jgi:hypothetical protein